MRDYGLYIGKKYPPPDGCILLVSSVFRTIFERAIPEDAGERVMEVFRKSMFPVDDPQEGDVVLMRGEQWHVGVVVKKGSMLHAAPPDGRAVIERYNSLHWKSRVKGFYRWR
mgnify:CR=1 FL=1